MSGNSLRIQAKREKRRDEIVQIAARLFEEQGFEKVSLLDVARQFGKGRTTIYEYFRDKNELLAACLEREMIVYHEKITSIMKAPGTLRNRLLEFIKVQLVYGAAHAGYSRLFRILTREATTIAVKTRTSIGRLHGEVYGALTRELESAVRKGEIKKKPVELTMQLLINATSLPIRSTAAPDKIAEDILSLFWSGMEK